MTQRKQRDPDRLGLRNQISNISCANGISSHGAHEGLYSRYSPP